ncbi:tRNA (guanosine(37)-N1)-methyltransferase TrmD [Desulfovibrio sp. SGI.169]|uniref:tRNA (guanosine(37)-N1)-methyltransferase TrmD n=1 Tax=Desulfovibrio sp. SGI.169 TaxID=3420561 RepID=UPI003D05D1D0
MPHFHLVSLFPEFFASPLDTALMGRARESGLVKFSFHDPRAFSADKRRHVDDRPYGGGPGMVMMGEPVALALRSIERPGRMLLMTPGGRPLNQALARELAAEEDITLICGRYEGLDARLSELFPLEPVSVGEAVLNGGETAALAVIESVARLTPGFMGKEESGEEESFSHGLLEYPHYTRPERLEGLSVPEALLSGDHGRIAAWRRAASLAATLRARPDLLDTAPLTRDDARTLSTLSRERPGRNLSFCLVHYPVLLGEKNSGASSLTNLDIHDIARISRSYAMGPFYAVTPLEDQLRLLEDILRHWTRGPGGENNPDRARALELVRPASSLDEAVAQFAAHAGATPRLIASSAVWPARKRAPAPLTPGQARDWCREGPVMLCLGTAQGLAPEVLERCEGQMRPLRFLGYNHLSVRSAAAILADRILGDYC